MAFVPPQLTSIFFLFAEHKSSWNRWKMRWCWTIQPKTRYKTNEAVLHTCRRKFYAQTPPTREKQRTCGRLALFCTQCLWEGELLVYGRTIEDAHASCLRLLGNGKSHETSPMRGGVTAIIFFLLPSSDARRKKTLCATIVELSIVWIKTELFAWERQIFVYRVLETKISCGWRVKSNRRCTNFFECKMFFERIWKTGLFPCLLRCSIPLV